ncbi:VirK/YbjX family protein [Lelliottia sp. V89_10]|uniref:VirK/YbjX family protein n=1 Tax=Lelliottia wanjuensis TaxID=3050585 RepID=UPI00249F76AB|nr:MULTISPECIES: VirK/YbjX family protein [unclassified Lelliottia]MDI3359645.1 VirK/YbjX family protein [Lelliottia sp. V89_13]MDK9548603.1 VirK/YbjX family protein [Lelliottia sp. V89_5]MDK9597235.1 VirK/YbjX family protein [Lelliottia sp. V89_10]
MSSIADISSSQSSQPKSGWQLFQSLASGELTPGLAWQNPAYRRKFMLRTLATPFSTARLMASLAKQPRLMQMLQAQPGLPCRLHRPWLSVDMNRQNTLEALNWHYQSMSKTLPATLVNGYLSKQGVTLLTLTGKDELQFRIRLCTNAFLDKEGEATLAFCDHQNTVLAEMTFTLCQRDGKTTLFIGGLQGAKSFVPHELIQGATKACHGLFPKRLLVEAAMTLGAAFPVEQIMAVSNHTHIYRSWRYRKKKEGKLLADYDSFWLSLGGEAQKSGHFQLPLAMARKPMEEIASKKRSEYRRRYELLDSLIAQVNQAARS